MTDEVLRRIADLEQTAIAASKLARHQLKVIRELKRKIAETENDDAVKDDGRDK